jgi:hypothetical protein
MREKNKSDVGSLPQPLGYWHIGSICVTHYFPTILDSDLHIVKFTIWLVSGLVNEASSDILMMRDTMATSGVYKLAREAGLTPTQQELEKGQVQISLSSHCCLEDHPMGLGRWAHCSYRTKEGEIFWPADDDVDDDDGDGDGDDDDDDDYDDDDDDYDDDDDEG